MNILYITTTEFSSNSGVRKKIYGQVSAMNKAGLNTKVLAPFDGKISAIDGDLISPVGKYHTKGIFKFFYLAEKLYKSVLLYYQKEKFDGVYIRYSILDWNLMKLLKELKRERKKIFLEIPSYPYDLEYSRKPFYKKLALYMDRFFSKEIHKYVDAIFTPSPNQENIYGIKTVFFENGIDLAQIQKRNYSGPIKDVFRLLGVANLSDWHGYDRIIKGISSFVNKKKTFKILFNIVGDGAELPKLKKMATELNVQENIIFHGKKYDKELDDIYKESDVAVTSIAFFRLHFAGRTSLKTREACVKGIPFISVKGDPVFDENFEYMYTVEDKDVPVDVESIYNWFKNLDHKRYVTEMNQFAKENLGWDKTFKNVISYIKGHNRNDKRSS